MIAWIASVVFAAAAVVFVFGVGAQGAIETRKDAFEQIAVFAIGLVCLVLAIAVRP